VKRLVLAGGGHAHVEVLRRFAAHAPPDVELVLVSPHPHTPYSGMLPGLVAGRYAWADAHIDLDALAGAARARFLRTTVTAVDPAARTIRLDDGRVVGCDVLSLDTGSVPPRGTIRGADTFGIAVKPVDRFLAAWSDILAESPARTRRIAVVGGGAGGVEIALAMDARLRRLGRGVNVMLVTGPDGLLPGHAGGVRKYIEAACFRRGVQLLRGARVTACDAEGLVLADGARVVADWIVWTTGAAAPPWIAASGLATDAQGFVAVDAYLRSTSHPAVFAAGDIASMVAAPRPKSGVYAVRQGPRLAENLRRVLAGQALRSYAPQSRTLALLATGDGRAIASWGRIAVAGKWVWRWKDRIDRGFMRRYVVG